MTKACDWGLLGGYMNKHGRARGRRKSGRSALNVILATHLVLCIMGLVISTITQNPTALYISAGGIGLTLLAASYLLTRVASWHVPLALLAMVCFFMMAIAGIYSGAGAPLLLLNAIYVGLVAFLLPQIFWGRAAPVNGQSLEKIMTWIGLGLILLAVYWQVTGQALSFRFGDPLAPGVFGFYMVIAALAAFNLRRGKYLFALFAFFALLSQSRFAALGLLISLVIILGLSPKRILILAIIAGVGVLGVYIAVSNGWDPAFLRERQDASSGRFFIWAIVWEGIAAAPLFGNGVEPTVYGLTDDPERYFGAHNSFLSLAYQFGIPVAVLAYVFFLALWVAALRNPFTSLQEKRFISALAMALLLRSMVTNTFWTNMADATSLFVILTMAQGIRRPKLVRRPPARRAPRVLLDKPSPARCSSRAPNQAAKNRRTRHREG